MLKRLHFTTISFNKEKKCRLQIGTKLFTIKIPKRNKKWEKNRAFKKTVKQLFYVVIHGSCFSVSCQLNKYYTLLINLKITTYSILSQKDESDLFLFSLITKDKESNVFNCTEYNVVEENHIAQYSITEDLLLLRALLSNTS